MHLNPFRIPPVDIAIIKKEVNYLSEAGIITLSNSACSLPVVIAIKKDGRTLFRVEYRQFNRVIYQDPLLLPMIAGFFEELSGAKNFKTLDLCKGNC